VNCIIHAYKLIRYHLQSARLRHDDQVRERQLNVYFQAVKAIPFIITFSSPTLHNDARSIQVLYVCTGQSKAKQSRS
jgi:hypothetical protein